MAKFCGTPVTAAQHQLIAEVVAAYPQLSRLELAKTVCELLNWVRPNGQLKSRECLSYLEGLHAQALIVLPALRKTRPRGSTTRILHTPAGDPQDPIEGPLANYRPIHLQQVTTRSQQRLWRELIDRHHYLGYRVPFGAQLRYLIHTSTPAAALLGCLQFSSPAWRMQARDQWIGWDQGQRQRNLQHLISNSRFLILPWVQIPNLASHVLATAAHSVATDWQQRYAQQPYLIETLVDPARYTGHCYRAANWLEVGVTAGRGRQDRHHQRHGHTPKRIYLYPLVADAPARLRQTV